MSTFSVFCFDEVSWFLSVYLELAPGALADDER